MTTESCTTFPTPAGSITLSIQSSHPCTHFIRKRITYCRKKSHSEFYISMYKTLSSMSMHIYHILQVKITDWISPQYIQNIVSYEQLCESHTAGKNHRLNLYQKVQNIASHENFFCQSGPSDYTKPVLALSVLEISNNIWCPAAGTNWGHKKHELRKNGM